MWAKPTVEGEKMASNISVSAKETNGEQHVVYIDGPPQECPVCHRGQRAESTGVNYLIGKPKEGFQALECIYRCIFEDCERTFISQYLVKKSERKGRFIRSLPEATQKRAWDDAIKAVSPEFVGIYHQSQTAEAKELDKIAGPGYRKALEFLIKDWLIANNVGTEEKIRTMFLGKCINDYIDESHIKAVAARAAWLGNDETHYYKKWTDKDINDLKKLIELTANWINIHELSNSVVKDMPEES
jgi:hypothetical protein